MSTRSSKIAVPTITRALADNHVELADAKGLLWQAREAHRIAVPTDISPAWQLVLERGSAVAELELHRDRLIASLSAHELEWAHLPSQCLICTVQVRLNEEGGRPF